MIAFVGIPAMVYSFPSCWRRGDFFIKRKEPRISTRSHIMIHLQIDAL